MGTHIDFNNQRYHIEKMEYPVGKRLGLTMEELDTMEMFAVISVNLPEDHMEANEIAYDINNLPEELLPILEREEILEATDKSISSGFVAYPVYKVLI